MDQQLSMQINDAFVNLYQEVYDQEKRVILSGEFMDLSYNDVHIIDVVGIAEPHNMSWIAKQLSVTVGSLTTAMNGLERKGYVCRERSRDDRRVIYIRLTGKGESVYTKHREFHRRAAEALCSGEEESTLQMALELLKRAAGRAGGINEG